MNIANLSFFDKQGESYNFNYDSQAEYWHGKDWLKPISINLFDSINVFMLEKIGSSYVFPILENNQQIVFKWKELEHSSELFLYNVVREAVTNNQFIDKTEEVKATYSEFENLSTEFTPPITNIKANVSGQNVLVTFDYGSPEIPIEYTLYSAPDPDTMNPLSSSLITSGNQLSLTALNGGGYFIEFKATAIDNPQIFSLYGVYFEITGGTSISEGYNISKSEAPINLSYPFQVNVAFNPLEERSYTRTLEGFLITTTTNVVTRKFLELEFYGEGEGEDERLRVWGENFGIKFNREDALILKEYDIKEGLPDYNQLNLARKELLVSKEHIFPYIGTYKALSNFINILGYKDILRVKEYWKNSNSNSEYYNKMGLVDITDFLDDGTIDDINFLDLNKQIKFNNQFKKTSMLALVYEFTATNGEFDEDGIPEVEKTTEFSVNEIFFKLNKLSKKLKREILPLSIQIKDIIGEFIFFQKYNLRYWTDRIDIEKISVSQHLDLRLAQPKNTVRGLGILDIKSLFSKKDKEFPVISFNNSDIDPFEDHQLYDQNKITDLVDVIEDFYAESNKKGFTEIGHVPIWESYDEPNSKIGCPIVLEAHLPDYSLQSLDGVTIESMGENQIKVGTVKYANYYEVGWKITKIGDNPYTFEYRGPVSKLYKLPHILPSVGEYLIDCSIFDLFGGVSRKFTRIEVEPFKPVLAGVMRINDKFDYTISNLGNIKVEDLSGSYVYNPRAIVLDNNYTTNTADIDKKLLDWNTYSNKVGFNINMLEVEIENDNGVFESYNTSSQPYKKYWGTAEDTYCPKVSDFNGAKVEDLFHSKLYDLSYQSDFHNGFNIPLSSIGLGAMIKIGNYNGLLLLPGLSNTQILTQLNVPGINGISDYTWSIVGGTTLHAQAKFKSKALHLPYTVEP